MDARLVSLIVVGLFGYFSRARIALLSRVGRWRTSSGVSLYGTSCGSWIHFYGLFLNFLITFFRSLYGLGLAFYARGECLASLFWVRASQVFGARTFQG